MGERWVSGHTLTVRYLCAPCGSSEARRVLSSLAALLVNVMHRMSLGATRSAAIKCATRYVSTRVLPEPCVGGG